MIARVLVALALSGCTVLGTVQGVQSANIHNAERERAIAEGKPAGEPASPAARGLAYGLIGLAIDVVIVVFTVPRVVPHE